MYTLKCTAWSAFDCEKYSFLANLKNLNLHNEVHTNSLWSKGHLTVSVRSIDGRISFPNVISCTRLKNKKNIYNIFNLSQGLWHNFTSRITSLKWPKLTV